MSLNLARHGYPHTDPDLPGCRPGYSDIIRQREIAADAVRTGAAGCLDDMWAADLWAKLPTALQGRLRRANAAMEQRPYEERAAVIYQARFAEAVAYLGSDGQVAE